MYNIAICDDNKKYVNYLKEIIIKTGLKRDAVLFWEFYSGEELEERISKKDFCCDLLILDMTLPGMDGDRVANIFREKFKLTRLCMWRLEDMEV